MDGREWKLQMNNGTAAGERELCFQAVHSGQGQEELQACNCGE